MDAITALRLVSMLHDTLTGAGLPVASVSVASPDDKATWRVTYTQILSAEQDTQAAALIAAFDPESAATINAANLAMATASSRQKDTLAMIAWALRRSNVTAWNGLSLAGKKAAVLAEADNWRDLRVFIEQNL